MRIQHLIYRIELPNTTAEERAQVEDLKDVLSKIILYEKTPCPFRRGFTIELPEELELDPIPTRRSTMGPVPLMSRAKRWEMKDIWRREGEAYRPTVSEMNSPEDSEDEGVVKRENELPTAVGKQEVMGIQRIEQNPATVDETKPPIRPRASTNRSFTAPAQLTTVAEAEGYAERSMEEGEGMNAETRPSVEMQVEAEPEVEAEAEGEAIAEATTEAGTAEEPEAEQEQQTSYQNVGEPLKRANIEQDSDDEHERDIADRSRASSIRSYYTSIGLQSTFPPSPASEYHDPFDSLPLYPYTITAEGQTTNPVQFVTTRNVPTAPTGSDVTTQLSATYPPSLISDATDSTSVSGHRPTSSNGDSTDTIINTTGTTLSLTRPRTRTRTSTISSSTSASRPVANFPPHYRQTQNRRTTSLVSRTYALLLGPPSGLVSAMVQIASRITSGTLSHPDHSANAVAHRYNLDGLPGRWEDSEEERDGRGVEPLGDSFATRALGRGREEEGADDDDMDDLEEDDYYDGMDDDDDTAYTTSAGRTPASVRCYKHVNEEEDDFGVPLGNGTPARKGRRNWGWVRSPPRKTPVKKLEQQKQEQQQQEDDSVQDEEGLRVEEAAPPRVD